MRFVTRASAKKREKGTVTDSDTILDYITEVMDFKAINWCSFVIEAMRPYKISWERKNPNKQFAGPLTIPIVN